MTHHSKAVLGSRQPPLLPGRSFPRLGWPALLVALSLTACTRTPPPEEPQVTEPEGSSLFLELKSLTGEAIPGGEVRLVSGPQAKALVPGSQLLADEHGQLLLEQIPEGEQLLEVQASGFSPTLVAVNVDREVKAGARLELPPLGEPIRFDASQGISEYPVGNDIELTVPPGSLRDEKGEPIVGDVDLFVTTLDLDEGELRAAPGTMQGLIGPDAKPTILNFLGVVRLAFKQDNRYLPMARRIGVRGRLPGTIRLGSLGHPGRQALSKQLAGCLPRVPAWRLDTRLGGWIPTGDLGRLVQSPSDPDVYEWEVTVDNPLPVFSAALPSWACSEQASADNPLQVPNPPWVEMACVDVQVEDELGQPVAGRMVMAQGLEYVGLSRGLTDRSGRVRLEVMRNKRVKVEAGEGSEQERKFASAGTCQQGEGAEPERVTLRVAVRACTPGAARDCAYSGAKSTLGRGACRAGWEYCDADGAQWSGACKGEVTPQQEQCGNELDDDCDGELNETCASVCAEGEVRDCYEGPEGTAGVGVCKKGTQQCVAGGTSWTACSGQVLPTPEDCSRPQDEDCNAVSCLCWPGGTKPCPYSGPPGTEGVGACHAGAEICNETGTGWEACTGEVTPLPQEDCTTPVDDDCDGDALEPAICICVPNSSRDCYTGPNGTENVGVCRKGTETCNAAGTAWGACTGEVTPQPQENCSTPGDDDDCDGDASEPAFCICVPNSSRSCYSGPTGTQGVGICQEGTQLCNPSGTAWGVCTGEVTPQVEICDDALDSSCDGQPNEQSSCGAWVMEEIMGLDRREHVAALLRDGRVLITGGLNSSDAHLKTTVVYDEENNSWSGIADMSTPRSLPAATLLPDGKVLVTGGYNGSGSLSSAEVYNPGSNSWTNAASMAVARYRHTATLLPDGKVLVAGGDNVGAPTSSTQVYDPSNDSWTNATPLAVARYRHTATLLPNGKVLVAGGYNGSNTLNSAAVYDPSNDSWTNAASMTWPRSRHTATLLPNGKVLVAGGNNVGGSVGTAEVYDPTNDTWSLYNMAHARDWPTATLLPSGKVLVAGGYNGSNSLASAEVFDPATGSWSAVPTMPSARHLHTATLLPSGKVFIAGGRLDNSGTLDSFALYDPPSPWASAASMASPRHWHTATLLPNGKVLVTGGTTTGLIYLDTAALYDPATKTWTPAAPMNAPRDGHTATLLPNGKVLIAGGESSTDTFVATAELYDPGSDTWTNAAPMNAPRDGHTATLLSTGKVLVAGGESGTNTALNTAELYDPGNNTWTPLTNFMVVARREHTATLLNDGKVLVTGGRTSAGQLSSAEVFDPMNNSWTATSSPMSSARDSHTATLLPNGKVLVAGGFSGGSNFLNSAELYDPAATANPWSSTNPMTLVRHRHTATLLPNGLVLVIGGGTGTSILNSTETFNPVTHTWLPGLPMSGRRFLHTATLLPGGSVLVTGGYQNDILGTVEVYTP